MRRYVVDLVEPEALRAATAGGLAAGGLLVPDAPTQALFETIGVGVTLPGASAPLELVGQVVNRAPGGGMFVAFAPGAALEGLRQAAAAALEAAAATAAAAAAAAAAEQEEEVAAEPEADDDGLLFVLDDEDGDGSTAPLETARPAEDVEPRDEQVPADDEEPEDGDEEAGAPADKGGPLAGVIRPPWELVDMMSDVPLYKQVAELTVSERIRLARHAPRPVRRLLAHDIEKRVHIEVVQNPKITDEEIVELSAMGGLSARALRWLGKQPRYTRRRDILFNLVVNPATPRDTALQLLDRLTQQELVRILRSSKAREIITRTAKHKLMKAGVI